MLFKKILISHRIHGTRFQSTNYQNISHLSGLLRGLLKSQIQKYLVIIIQLSMGYINKSHLIKTDFLSKGIYEQMVRQILMLSRELNNIL